MELKKNIKNSLMKRQEVSYLVESEKNPTFSEMKQKISAEMKKPEETIDVYGVQGKFGRRTFLIKAYVYDSKEDLETIKNLSKTKKQRIAGEEEKKKAEETPSSEADASEGQAKKPKEESGEEAKETPTEEVKEEKASSVSQDTENSKDAEETKAE